MTSRQRNGPTMQDGEKPTASAAQVVESGACKAGNAKDSKDLFIIYILVIIYAFCFQLQAPLEPFLLDRLTGKDDNAAVVYGRLQSFFQGVQAVGSVTFGYILDRWGVRCGFAINFLACALVYGILANTDSISMLYLSKVPGIAMTGFLCAQTAVSQVTAVGEDRVVALGRLTTAYTIGGAVGPYMGGLLGAKGDYFISAKLAVAGSLVAVFLTTFLQKGNAKEKAASGAQTNTTNVPWVSRATAVWQTAGFLIGIKLTTGVANSMASSTQAIVLKNSWSFSESDLGFFMSCQFAFGGFANGFLLAPATRLLGGQARIVVGKCVTVMAAGYGLQAALNSQVSWDLLSWGTLRAPVYISISMLLSLVQYSMGTSITAESTKLVPEHAKGTLIGFEHSVFAAARILTPTIGTTILHVHGASALYGTCAIVFSMIIWVWALFANRCLPRHD